MRPKDKEIAEDQSRVESQPEPQAPEAEAPAEQADLKDKYLRLAADFDNFRKRALREREEMWGRARADLVERLVDALDDLARFAHVDPEVTDSKTMHEGMEMVERKVWKALDAAGVQRIDQVGVRFDPKVHEAVTTTPAESFEQDHTVASVLQAGYQLGNALIRPARVVVRVWPDSAQPVDG
ncbi:MAG TPA: nucleotide exchange factor GrpE [Gemmatimonadales bacterium]